jgi:hypothetical protein
LLDLLGVYSGPLLRRAAALVVNHYQPNAARLLIKNGVRVSAALHDLKRLTAANGRFQVAGPNFSREAKRVPVNGIAAVPMVLYVLFTDAGKWFAD